MERKRQGWTRGNEIDLSPNLFPRFCQTTSNKKKYFKTKKILQNEKNVANISDGVVTPEIVKNGSGNFNSKREIIFRIQLSSF